MTHPLIASAQLCVDTGEAILASMSSRYTRRLISGLGTADIEKGIEQAKARLVTLRLRLAVVEAMYGERVDG